MIERGFLYLYRWMPGLLFLSISYVFWAIAVDRYKAHAQEIYQQPTTSELGRELKRQGIHVDNLESAISQMALDIAVMKTSQAQVIETQNKMSSRIEENSKQLNARFDNFYYFLIVLMVKALYDLATQYILPALRSNRR